MKTFRRDKLRRLVEAGRVRVLGSYSFDDQYGQSIDTAKGMLAALKPADWHDQKPGVCYMFDCYFTSKCGRAYLNDSGTVTLYVHSNSNYELAID